MKRPESFEKLVAILRTLPSVGPKMSERMAYRILRMPEEEMKVFIQVLQEAHRQMRPCQVCGHWDDSSPCGICRDSGRDRAVLCVVENSQDVLAVSRIKDFRGIYHVLGGALSPLEGIGPQDLQIASLMKRLEEEPVTEVILALNSDIEGETTAQYLADLIEALSSKIRGNGRPGGIKITRPAQGLPAGGELEYMDELTLSRAFGGRREFDRN
ncbi:MAG: recombination protein RecR [Elusimicrobia bacterium RIFCSPLOWO2_01_FULL_60_11]|nr:MAG: recombination protein RecR [Elusimicrobia bacterium RIFCSPLOWO2_01_FULL_60_11]